MKCRLKTNNLEFEIEGNTQKELFSQIAEVMEIFGEKNCGLCKGTNLKYVVREIQSNSYFELTCSDCGGKLTFGQLKAKQGKLFPKRKLTKEGKPSIKNDASYTSSKGWTKYRGDVEKDV